MIDSEKKNILNEGEAANECKELAAQAFNHLENVRATSKNLYQAVKSFLRYPYHTVC